MGDWYHQSTLSSFERRNKLGGLEPTLSLLCFAKFPYLLDLSSVLFCFAFALSCAHEIVCRCALDEHKNTISVPVMSQLVCWAGLWVWPPHVHGNKCKSRTCAVAPPTWFILLLTIHPSSQTFFFSFKEQWSSASTESFLSEKYFSKA